MTVQELMGSIARLNSQIDGMQSEMAKLRHENAELERDKRRLAVANSDLLPTGVLPSALTQQAPKGEPEARGFKITLKLDEGQNIPTSASLWDGGQDWVAGAELVANVSLTTKSGEIEETSNTVSAKLAQRPEWRRAFCFNVDANR